MIRSEFVAAEQNELEVKKKNIERK